MPARRKHHPLRIVALPPPSQSGGFATRTPKLREMCLVLGEHFYVS